MTIRELRKQAAAWERARDAVVGETTATDGDITEAQNARLDELRDEAVSIKRQLGELGFASIFEATEDNVRHVAS